MLDDLNCTGEKAGQDHTAMLARTWWCVLPHLTLVLMCISLLVLPAELVTSARGGRITWKHKGIWNQFDVVVMT